MLTRPGLLLSFEGLCVLVAAIVAYSTTLHGRWLWFAVFFLTPDLSLLGYLSRTHAAFAAGLYNFIHSHVLPLILGFAAWTMASVAGEQAAAIWIAHIAFDRLLGLGLKYPEAFKPTHLQIVTVYRT